MEQDGLSKKTRKSQKEINFEPIENLMTIELRDPSLASVVYYSQLCKSLFVALSMKKK